MTDDAGQHQHDDAAPQCSRRSILSATTIGWTALTGSAGLCALAANRFLHSDISSDELTPTPIGTRQHWQALPAGHVDTSFDDKGFRIVRLTDRLVAIDPRCTHLGCVTRWNENKTRFDCPCHGSQFDLQGLRLLGPAKRPLDRFAILSRGQSLIVDPRRRFASQSDGWNQPDSYIAM